MATFYEDDGLVVALKDTHPEGDDTAAGTCDYGNLVHDEAHDGYDAEHHQSQDDLRSNFAEHSCYLSGGEEVSTYRI